MSTHASFILGLAAAATLARPAPAAAPSPGPVDGVVPVEVDEAPTLVVLVAVDQLRADMLTGYRELWRHGFRRLLDQGLVFTQASHRHAHTQTAPGHATLATGVHPARHGIVANDFRLRRRRAADAEEQGEEAEAGAAGSTWSSVYSVGDPEAPILGLEGEAGGRSPANLLRDGLADWIRAAHPGARVAAVATKDRSAIALAGRVPDAHVYWIHDSNGRFVTSTHYRDRYPPWVERVNRELMPRLHADTVWRSTAPPEARRLARPDDAPYEFDGVHTTLPHRAHEEVEPLTPWGVVDWIRHSPRLDSAVLELALEAVDALSLGQREPVVDYLGMSFSQVDYVGHRYGPWSQEQLDNLLRLDRLLGRLFDALDRRVGEGRWTLALSADHGVMTMPEWRAEQGLGGWRVGWDRRQELRAAVAEAVDGMPEPGLAGAGSPADEAGRAWADSVARARLERAREAARPFGFVGRLYPSGRYPGAGGGEPADSFAALFRNSFHPDRRAGPLVRLGFDLLLAPGALLRTSSTGTSHGSAHWHDRHVPLVLLGAGVEPGVVREPVGTVDVAPSLAALAGVPRPDDLDGRPLVPLEPRDRR